MYNSCVGCSTCSALLIAIDNINTVGEIGLLYYCMMFDILKYLLSLSLSLITSDLPLFASYKNPIPIFIYFGNIYSLWQNNSISIYIFFLYSTCIITQAFYFCCSNSTA